ncbi:MAG: AI-2E family transporter [Candidatus Saccharimonadales bacterium]
MTVTAGFLLVLYAIYVSRTVLTWVVTAFALALALNPPVAWTERKIPGHSRILATLLVFVGLLIAFGVLAVTLFPPVVGQTQQLISNLPSYTNQLTSPGTFTGDLIAKYDLMHQIQRSQSELVSRLTNASGTFAGIVFGVFSSILAIVSIFGLVFFMLLEGPNWIGMFWQTQAASKRAHGKRLAAEMYQAMVGYVNGKLLAAGLAGITAAIALIVLGVPYAAALALVLALLSIIPIFGATIGALIVVGVCLFTSVSSAIIMLIFFFIYQQIENNIIQPVIFKKVLDVSPLLVFISVLVGTAAAGILGALVAIPVTASLQILIRDFYARESVKEAKE